VLVPWESHAENLGGGGQRLRDKLKSDWVTGARKKAPSHYNWGLEVDCRLSVFYRIFDISVLV
jgi:hypothetical protein